MDIKKADQAFDDNRESAKLRNLEIIATNSHYIANELKRIADILEKNYKQVHNPQEV